MAVQIPTKKIDSIESLRSIPLTAPSSVALLQAATLPAPNETPSIPAQLLGNIANIYHRVIPENITHYTVQRVLNVDATVEGRDLGFVASETKKKISELGELPPGTRITLRGQNQVMEDSFRSLALGLILATLLVYFLMVILFQSWLDPFIIMTAVPGVLVGILAMLAVTVTTIDAGNQLTGINYGNRDCHIKFYSIGQFCQ